MNKSDTFRKVVLEDDNFELIEIQDINIYNKPYHKFEVKTKKNSEADDCVISIRVDSFDKEEEDRVLYFPRSTTVIPSTRMIRTLADANKFAAQVSQRLQTLLLVQLDKLENHFCAFHVLQTYYICKRIMEA